MEALLGAIRRGEPVGGGLARPLRPSGVLGALEQMPLTEILQNMDFGKRSGRVDVWQADAEATVHVHDGQIVFAAATTTAGVTEGEAAILEVCRRSGGSFSILYLREEVPRNVQRPTTFVLLEALRVIDESSQPRGETPAAVDLGPAPAEPRSRSGGRDAPPVEELPWGGSLDDSAFPPNVPADDAANPFNDPSVVIEVDADTAAPPPLQQHPRYRVGATIHVAIGDQVVPLFLEDLGRGGAFLRTASPPPRDTVVVLRLPAGDRALELPARVVHVLDAAGAASVAREPGIGVRFDELEDELARLLGAFVDELAERQAGAGGRGASARERMLGLLAESEFLVAAGDLDAAQRVLSQAQGLAPDDDDVRRKLLSVNEAIDAAQANAFLEQALRGGPRAVELARRAMQLRPVRDVLLRSLAVFARGGAFDEVGDVAEQLLELDPEDEGALRTLLDANVALQRWSVAARAAESLLRKRPNDESLRATLERVVGLARRAQ